MSFASGLTVVFRTCSIGVFIAVGLLAGCHEKPDSTFPVEDTLASVHKGVSVLHSHGYVTCGYEDAGWFRCARAGRFYRVRLKDDAIVAVEESSRSVCPSTGDSMHAELLLKTRPGVVLTCNRLEWGAQGGSGAYIVALIVSKDGRHSIVRLSDGKVDAVRDFAALVPLPVAISRAREICDGSLCETQLRIVHEPERLIWAISMLISDGTPVCVPIDAETGNLADVTASDGLYVRPPIVPSNESASPASGTK